LWTAEDPLNFRNAVNSKESLAIARDSNIQSCSFFIHTDINDVLSINNHIFHVYVHLTYPDELEIKDTTESDISASYLNILPNIDSNGRLTTTLYDKRDDFNFAIVKFRFLCSSYEYTTFACLWCVYLPVDSICKSMVCVWEHFKARLTTDKKVDVAGLKRISFKVVISEIPWSL
jgi:hypothetical protein